MEFQIIIVSNSTLQLSPDSGNNKLLSKYRQGQALSLNLYSVLKEELIAYIDATSNGFAFT